MGYAFVVEMQIPVIVSSKRGSVCECCVFVSAHSESCSSRSDVPVLGTVFVSAPICAGSLCSLRTPRTPLPRPGLRTPRTSPKGPTLRTFRLG